MALRRPPRTARPGPVEVSSEKWTELVKRQRLSAEELRDRMLDTAKSMIADAGGLTVSLAHLNMEEIIRAAGVPRSSVYREWAAREDFYVDLMVELSVDDGPADKVFDQARWIPRSRCWTHSPNGCAIRRRGGRWRGR